MTVAGTRLTGWVRGFAERHGAVSVSALSGGVLLAAADGATARLAAPFGTQQSAHGPAHDRTHDPADDLADDLAGQGASDPDALLRELIDEVLRDRTVAVLLVRRGGYAAAMVRGEKVLASKVGSRYVQGRTAAGGWSQQRFARRRDKQTQELVDAAAEVAARVLTPLATVQSLVTGGDRPLVEQVLADARLRALARLPRGPHLAVGDPRADVVRAVPGMLRSVRIMLTGG